MKLKLNDKQIMLVAMHLATSNLARPTDTKDETSIKRAWQRCVEVHASDDIDDDTTDAVEGELMSWKRDVKKGGSYIEKVIKEELPWVLSLT